MSKLSFRARALDATKPMPVYEAEEIPDLPDFAAINRAVPQMPTGMEKEEETEHHLQRALSAQQVYGTAEALVIPVPEIEIIGDRYTKCYAPKTGEFKPPKQFVHVQPFGMDQEIPDYDMDSEDETWMNKQARKMEISATQFENMMDRLEKGSGQQVVTLQEAKLLLKEDDDLIIAVYDYWLNKRLRTQHALIPTVRTEKRDGSTSNNPYVAFRRRTEKMQTRKNRKNDEASYEKMLKLRRDLNKALTILELVKRREKSKKELLQLTIEVVDQRYQMGDFNGQCLQEAQAQRHKIPSFIQIQNQLANRDWTNREEGSYVRKKREYKKRKYKQQNNTQQTVQPVPPVSSYQEVDILHGDIFSSDDDALSPTLSPSDHESDDPDGHYAFRRKANCHYQAPILDGLGNWPWCGREDGGFADKKYRYSLASLSSPRKCIGFARRRVGRGGRVLVDRGFTPWDDDFENIDLSSSSPGPSRLADLIAHIKQNRVVHFRPKSPTEVSGETIGGPNSESGSSTGLLSEFNLESFQNHQEQLLQMQRHQQQQLLQQQTELDASSHLHHSFSSLPTSHFTLDSAKAQFAASALLNSATADLHVLPSVPATVPTATTPAALTTVVTATTGATSSSVPSAVMTNGPKTQNKSSGFSTSPAATVLELNFPLPTATSSTKLDHVSVVTAVQSLSTTTTVTSKNNCQPSNTVMKLGTSANNHKHSSLAIDNHEETPQVNSLVADTGVAMEVT